MTKGPDMTTPYEAPYEVQGAMVVLLGVWVNARGRRGRPAAPRFLGRCIGARVHVDTHSDQSWGSSSAPSARIVRREQPNADVAESTRPRQA